MFGAAGIYFTKSFFLWDNLTDRTRLNKMNEIHDYICEITNTVIVQKPDESSLFIQLPCGEVIEIAGVQWHPERYKKVNKQTIKEIRIAYFRFPPMLFEEIMPIRPNKVKTTGNSKQIPKAKIKLMLRDRYSLTFGSETIGNEPEPPSNSKARRNS